MKRVGFLVLVVFACLLQAQDLSKVNSPNKGGAATVLVAGGTNVTLHALSSAEVYDQSTRVFTATGSMNQNRVGHTATRLGDGSVLVTGGGGQDPNLPVASAELYDPKTGTFGFTGSMSSPRVGHTAVLLNTNLVLVAGGQNAGFNGLRTAELYDPPTGNFTLTGRMHQPRTGHTATLLNDGKVLVAGGQNNTTIIASAELYDPGTGTFALTGTMSTPRLYATATLLADGRVLIAGGGSLVGTCINCSVASAEIYDPASGVFTPVGNMHFARRGHTAVLLGDHNVLIAGGIDDELANGLILSSAELFNPQTLSFTQTANMKLQRSDHTASLLANGNVLIMGGFISGFTVTNRAEIFKRSTRSFVATGSMTTARGEHTATGF